MHARLAKLWGKKKPSRHVLEALIRQTSEAGLLEVAELVAERIENMPLAEARGYIRARGASIVRRHTLKAIQKYPQADSSCSDFVVRAAVELMLPKILRQSRIGIPRALNIRKAA